MDAQLLRKTREELTAELIDLDRKIGALQEQRNRLVGLEHALSEFLNASQMTLPGIPPDAIEGAEEDTPIWARVRDVFPQDGGTMTVPQIHNEMPLVNGNKPKQDAIRVAIRRKPEIFVNRGDGVFALTPEALRSRRLILELKN
jgi:hypothetical protein